MSTAISNQPPNGSDTRPRNTDTEATPCYNPATGELLGASRIDSPADVRAAVARARAAQPAWAALPVKERVAAIIRVRTWIATHANDIAETISRDNGKTRTDAMLTEVFPAALAATYYAKNARRFMASEYITPGNFLLANKISKIVRVPYGVVAIIAPWNYPFAIPFSEVVMGLLAGNAVLLKAASQT
jgi:acyl-CoA reductase-like NAD-dependent aldehyde dehydrogenase